MPTTCQEKYCYTTPPPGRKLCHKHRKRLWRQQHPLRDSFNNLRSHAKSRFIPFTLTLADWTRFCLRTMYLTLRGPDGDSATVDRKDPRVGYTYDNIQCLTRIENNKKQGKERLLIMVSMAKRRDNSDVPF